MGVLQGSLEWEVRDGYGQNALYIPMEFQK